MDHYGLDRRWVERIRPYVRRIMEIDDLANRLHSTNEMGKVPESLWCLNRPDSAIELVIGAANPHLEVIARACSRAPDIALSIRVDTMARILSAYDEGLPIPKDAVDGRRMKSLLRCAPLEPLYRVR